MYIKIAENLYEYFWDKYKLFYFSFAAIKSYI